MQTEWLQGYLLHRRPYRETSFLLDVLTREQGRVSVVAKGIRTAKSPRKGLLQPFLPIRLTLSGRSELKSLRQLESAGNAWLLNGTSMFCGMYINELLNRVLPQGYAAEDIFSAYERALSKLHNASSTEPALREFEYSVLLELGQLPDLTIEAQSGNDIDPQSDYRFVADEGWVPVLVQSKQAMPLVFRGDVILQLASGEWTVDSLRAAKQINRIALKPLLGERPLKSRELFSRHS